MNGATERFAQDLYDAGIAPHDIRRVARLYDRALTRAAKVDWERLYRATFFALRRTGSAAPRSRHAVESLLRLLEDDLGAALLEAEAVSRLRLHLSPIGNREKRRFVGFEQQTLGEQLVVRRSFSQHAQAVLVVAGSDVK